MIPGLFIGYEMQPVGIWSGDNLVYQYAPFQKNPEMTRGQARHYKHRIKEVRLYSDPRRPGDGIRFPLGERKHAFARLPPQLHARSDEVTFDNVNSSDDPLGRVVGEDEQFWDEVCPPLHDSLKLN